MAIKISLFLCLMISNFAFSQTNPTVATCIENEESYLYLLVDKLPTFKYKNMNVIEYLYSNMEWPSEFDGQFSIVVSFVVKKDGRISNIRIEKGFCPECNNEVIRVLNLMPKWCPGKINKKNVDVLLYLPISFRIIDDSKVP